MKEFWDQRYGQSEYAYGQFPNEYLKQQISHLPAGRVLFPAEGEGRNAVFAANLGWEVSAFDISIQGQKKALALAEKFGVAIDYQVADFSTIDYPKAYFDAIVLIYAHFPASMRMQWHQQLDQYLRPGGLIILEGFSKKHLEYNSKNEKAGGPKDLSMLFSIEDIQTDFPNYDILELVETEVELEEGLFHVGKGSVIRFTGRKK